MFDGSVFVVADEATADRVRFAGETACGLAAGGVMDHRMVNALGAASVVVSTGTRRSSELHPDYEPEADVRTIRREARRQISALRRLLLNGVGSEFIRAELRRQEELLRPLMRAGNREHGQRARRRPAGRSSRRPGGRVRRRASATRSRSGDSGDDGGGGSGDGSPSAFRSKFARRLGLSPDRLRWCRRCGRWAFQIDYWQRDELERQGWCGGLCPRCARRAGR